jgi:arylamine N-acetyltransferase
MEAHTDAYLARLGLDREPPSADALDRIHRRHVERVTYETTWIHLAEPWTIEPDASVRRIASAGRGGYCFHLNGALTVLLANLGYDVTMHVGGVHGAEPSASDLHNHLVLLVHGLPTPDHPDGTWYVDAGLGDALHSPLPLRAGTFEQEPMTFRLEPTPGGVADWHFTHDPSGSFAGMSFSLEPTEIDVFAARHEFLARSAESPFARTVTAQLRDGTGTTILRGQRFTRTERGGTSEHMIVDRDLWLGVLATTFHVDLSTASSDAIDQMWERAVAASTLTTAAISGGAAS